MVGATATLGKIFLGSVPYLVLIPCAALIVLALPELSSWLPGMLF